MTSNSISKKYTRLRPLRNTIEKVSPYIAILLMSTTFLIGTRVQCYYFNSPITSESSVAFFLKIVFQNSCFAAFLLLGGFFMNITTACLLLYNGFSWGKAFKDSFCNAGLEKTIMLVLPHIFIELFWIVFACQISVKLSFQFIDLLNDRMSISNLQNSFKEQTLKPIITVFLLVIFSAGIECFLTPLLYQSL